MKRLEDLPQITDEVLGGLQATPGLRARILDAAAAPVKKPVLTMPRAVAAVCCLALAVGVAVTLPRLPGSEKAVPDAGDQALMVMSGDVVSDAQDMAVPLEQEPIDEMDLAGTAAQPQLLMNQAAPEAALIRSTDEPVIYTSSAGEEMAEAVDSEASLRAAGSESVTVRAKQTSGGSRLWADAQNGAFPMVCVEGRYYRMLTAPVSVSSGILGSSVGTVDEFTTEPALASGRGVMSNTVPAGTDVCPVKGMDGTLIAAEVNGSLRVFQRVSFNGTALKGNEKLSDTLKLKGHISCMSIADVGEIKDASTCEKVFGKLLSSASYESSGSLSTRQTLQITLDNGLAVELSVKGDKLAACGVWSCPEFMEAFRQAAR